MNTSTAGTAGPEVAALLDLTTPSAAELAALHLRLVAAAERDNILDLAYTTIDTPVGPLLLAATEKGLVRVAFECENHDRVLETLSAKISPRVLRAPRRLDAAARELDEYFAGRRHRLRPAAGPLALQGLPASWYSGTCRRSPMAKTETTRRWPQTVGNPKAVRAVGKRLRHQPAARRRPLPPRAPHRRKPGRLPRRAGREAALLALESAA